MVSRFGTQNLYWHSIRKFEQSDKHLVDLRSYSFVHEFGWWKEVSDPGVYILSGGRQIGKTTSIKTFIKNLLKRKRVNSQQIFYLSCDQILDRDELYQVIFRFFESVNAKQISYLFLDEVTFVSDWHLAVKALIDEGILYKTVLVITGSDTIVLQDASKTFPGINRRGKKGKDFILQPLNFPEFLFLVEPKLLKLSNHLNDKTYSKIEQYFQNFLICGGYLNAINELMTYGKIPQAIFDVYEQWILSDFIRKGKDKKKLQDLLYTLTKRITSQLSYNEIARESSSLCTDTVIEYIDHLERLGVIKTLYAFDQNTLSGFPKKNKKFYFSDPFLERTIFSILKKQQLFAHHIKPDEAHLVETVAITHYARKWPVFYLKSEGEIDMVIVHQGLFYPVEIKWTSQIRPKNLKQLTKYSNSVILQKRKKPGIIQGIPMRPLILELLQPEKNIFKSHSNP